MKTLTCIKVGAVVSFFALTLSGCDKLQSFSVPDEDAFLKNLEGLWQTNEAFRTKEMQVGISTSLKCLWEEPLKRLICRKGVVANAGGVKTADEAHWQVLQIYANGKIDKGNKALPIKILSEPLTLDSIGRYTKFASDPEWVNLVEKKDWGNLVAKQDKAGNFFYHWATLKDFDGFIQMIKRYRQKDCDSLCVFHAKLDTDSTRIWTVIPRQSGH